MGALYVSCEFDPHSGDVVGFGYDGIPAGEYVPPEGSNFLASTLSNAVVAAEPFGKKVITQSDFTGTYVIAGYSTRTAIAGDGVGQYDTHQTIKFTLPPGLSGTVRAFAKVEASGAVTSTGIDGGGLGYVFGYDVGESRAVECSVFCKTETAGDVTFTVHLIGDGPPPTEFWSSFIGSREIV